MIGDNIRKYRTEGGMTQKELAERLHVTSQAVSRWENGDVEPSVSTVAEIARIFGISCDDILGVETTEPSEPQVITEKEYVVKESQPVLAVCEKCNQPIYEGYNIVRNPAIFPGGEGTHVYCRSCVDKAIEKKKEENIKKSLFRRKLSLGLGIAYALIVLIVGICLWVGEKKDSDFIACIVLAITGFSLISCLILANNFVGGLVMDIMTFSFRMPGLIFTLDLDGLIWLLTVKLIGFLIGILVSIATFFFAIFIGAVVSPFVYPYAIWKNLKHPELFDE